MLLCGSVAAQSYHVYDVVWLSSGKPSPHSPIRICSAQPIANVATPCQPLANVYSDQALTQPKTQPFYTDTNGNYDFWVASPASYIVEYYPQGSPVAVHQVLTAPVTSTLPPGQPGPAGQDGAPGAPGYSPSQILSGCGVGYTGGLGFLVGPCKYLIAGSQGGTTLNITTNTALTGPAADPSLNRFDAIVGDSTGTLSIVPGTASANPGCPVLNATSQVQIFCYEVDAGATTPANINILDIYHENAEWTCAVSAHLNCASTVNPHTGIKDIEATAAVLTNFANLTIPAGTIDVAGYNDLIFNIASKADWAGLSLTLQWYNGTTAKCTPVTVFNGQFGFDSTRTAYQQVDVPLRLFNCNGIPVTRLQYKVSGTGTSLGFYLDDIYLQGGATNSTGSDFMKWQHGTVGTNGWSSSKQYKINDTVTRLGNTYTAIADSVNAPPESNPAIWDPHTTYQPAGVDNNIQTKCGNQFCAINTTVSGNDVTFPGKVIATEIDATAVTDQGLTISPVTSPTVSGAGEIKFISNAGTCQISQNGGSFTACGAGGVAGSNQQVQFNDAGAFGADSQFLYDKSTHILTVGTSSSQGTIDMLGAAGAPSNPSAGYCRQYFNSTSGKIEWINSAGTSCGPAASVSSVFSRTGAVVATSGDYTEAQISFTDITTNNVSTTKHGYAPKGDGNAAHYLDGTGAYSAPPAAASGSLVLLEEHTASASAALTFTTRNVTGQSGATFQSDYDEYMIMLVNVIPATNSVIAQVKVSTNGGSSYDGGANYQFGYQYLGFGTLDTANVGGTGQTQINLCGTNIANATQSSTTSGVNGHIYLFNPLASATNKWFTWDVAVRLQTNNYHMYGAASYEPTTAVNAFEFLFSSGNIASGTVRVYGVAK